MRAIKIIIQQSRRYKVTKGPCNSIRRSTQSRRLLVPDHRRRASMHWDSSWACKEKTGDIDYWKTPRNESFHQLFLTYLDVNVAISIHTRNSTQKTNGQEVSCISNQFLELGNQTVVREEYLFQINVTDATDQIPNTHGQVLI